MLDAKALAPRRRWRHRRGDADCLALARPGRQIWVTGKALLAGVLADDGRLLLSAMKRERITAGFGHRCAGGKGEQLWERGKKSVATIWLCSSGQLEHVGCAGQSFLIDSR